MPKPSAGLLVYRRENDVVEVLLVHPAGPFWAHKDRWSIPKGELDGDEDHMTALRREFEEELGVPAPEEPFLELGESKQSDGKMNHIWAVEGDVDLSIDISKLESGMFTMEWPPKSGQIQKFPENDRAAWFDLATAKHKAYQAQSIFFDRLADALGVTIPEDPEQQALL